MTLKPFIPLKVSTARNFCLSTVKKACDDQNGKSLDTTPEVISHCKNNELSIINYYDEKEDSIIRENAPGQTRMLDQLHDQRDVVLHHGGFPSYLSSSSESSSDYEVSGEIDGGDNGEQSNVQESGNVQNSTSSTQNISENSTSSTENTSKNTSNSNNFRQDSSHLMSDDQPFDFTDE